jgi:hypothetical protein
MSLKNIQIVRILPGLLIPILFLSACNFPGLQPTQDQFATAAAETVSAELTQANAETTATIEPTVTTGPATEIPPTSTETPTETPELECSDKAGFVEDVTIPDDTRMDQDETFTKIWKLKNAGTCTWTTTYTLVFDSGNIMGGPPSTPLPQAVPPEGEINLEVQLTAPTTNGTHRGNWILRNDKGEKFGLGADADSTFFVQIVVGPTPTPKPKVFYNFLDRYCDATWTSGAGTLPCPGTDSDATGFVLKVNNPELENGASENEPALYTHPQWVNDGTITGTFPEIDIIDGDHFKTVIGCLFKSGGSACNVKFQIMYSANGGPMQILSQWTEIYDGTIRKVDIDLADSGLAGKSVVFSLNVLANGAAEQDWAFWLVPRIEGPSR